MSEYSYLRWLVRETPTTWWHDSADPTELDFALTHAASGVTTNPVLAAQSLSASQSFWRPLIGTLEGGLSAAARAERLMRTVVCYAAHKLEPAYDRTAGRQGYACAQVNPNLASNADAMLAIARRSHAWARNIAVKLPVTAAGLDTLEECAAEGITITATVSFTVPQVLAVAERYRRGLARARAAGHTLGQCFAVIMIGRLDDYLRDVAQDRRADVSEADIRQAGLAVTKRAYALFKERGYEAVLLVAALRGTYHMLGLAGAELIMSIHPDHQATLLAPGVPREGGIAVPVASEVIRRLEALPDFVRAYEPDGMSPEDFLAYGLTQRTLTQFAERGWRGLETSVV